MDTQQVFLENGLKVLIRETHAAPVASIWLWYRVGSRNEVRQFTGLAHWVEHMLFKGSSRYAKGEVMRAVDRLGGHVNAMTSHDFTAYYATLPSDRAELALDFLSDQMTSALFDPEEVAAERGVIIAEREGSENEPHYVLAEEVTAAAFHLHPYRHQTIGWKQDLLQITRDDLVAYYRRYYVPNNAVLVIVGDVNPEICLQQVRRYFEGIPAGTLVDDTIPQEPPQRGERRVQVCMPGATSMVRISFHTPPVAHPDYPALVIADAVLSGGKAMFAFGESRARSARLYRALVETQLASSVGSSYFASLDPYLFTIGATVRRERTPQEIEEALLKEIDRLRKEPVSDEELRVAVRQTQAQFAYSSESVTSQALSLGLLEMVDHYERAETMLEELAQVRAEDVLRVARLYFKPENRTVGWFIPTGNGSTEGDSNATQLGVGVRPWFYRGVDTPVSPESVVRKKLDNGITVLIKERPSSTAVTIGASIRAGAAQDPDGHLGLASLTASMLRRGTELHSFQELNVALDNVGASLSLVAGQDDTGLAARALADDMDLLLNLLTEVLTRPSFDATELEKLRGQLLTHLSLLHMDTGYRADRAFMELLYPSSHPYSRPILGIPETLSKLKREDLRAFYEAHYGPEVLTISIVGAIHAEDALKKLEATLGRWPYRGITTTLEIPDAQTPAEIRRRYIHIPSKPQADLILGVIGMRRSSPDYYAASMANVILGRLGLMGRLGRKVRDEKGLAYYVNSSMQASYGPQPWNIVAGIAPQRLDATVTAILEEIDRLREEHVSDEELEDCRTYLTGSLPLHLETNEGIASFLLSVESYGLGLDYLQRYPSIIQSVTPEQIREVVRRCFAPDRYVLTAAGAFEED